MCTFIWFLLSAYLVASVSSYQKHVGLFPESIDLAKKGIIWANGTCGEEGPETFCRLTRGRHHKENQCGVCDSRSHDKRHPPEYAIDLDSDTWWQSRSLYHGHTNQYATVTIDLRQVYQILHIRLRAGPSPRPGNWILEKSIDGKTYTPWQYFATSGEECWAKYSLKPSHQPLMRVNDQALCTPAFSKVSPIEGGEIHVGLATGWVNASTHSPEVMNFTSARYVRFRFQKMSSLKTRHAHGSEIARKFYYTIKDVLIQGRCNCNGHAAICHYNSVTGESTCDCVHKTTGISCEKCLPLYNQRPWKAGTLTEANQCIKCECNGHAHSCEYDPAIDATYANDGQFLGGGVCDHTTGINCEKCEDGWYREPGVLPNATIPCKPCDCHPLGSTGLCYKDNSERHLNKPIGSCVCKEGYTGPKCDQCAAGYWNFPNCEKCPCDPKGWMADTVCNKDICYCKPNVVGKYCDKCQPGYFFMDRDGSVECTECYCSGVGGTCERAEGYSVSEFRSMEGWMVSDLSASYVVEPYYRDSATNQISVAYYQMPNVESYYWMAPSSYKGNKLTSYGSTLMFSVTWDIMRGDTSGKPTTGPDVVLVGYNGLRIGYGNLSHKDKSLNITVPLVEEGWYHVMDNVKDIVTRLRRNQKYWEEYRGKDITRAQLLSVLANIRHLLVRAKFHTDQAEGSLLDSVLEIGYEGGKGQTVGFIEKCACPPGNMGLSCEQCGFGYTRITEGVVPIHKVICSKCNCHGHAATCDASTGQCGKCEHHTTGPLCEKCVDGYYGDASKGSAGDCRKCLCPLIEDSNNFSPTCQADKLGYKCTACPEGYTGRHCERCEPGYFGSPEELGSKCQPCDCNNGPCHHSTGQCLTCHGNTGGWRCEKCLPNHYGNPVLGCFPCECNSIGSENIDGCDLETGQCKCKDKFAGRTCDRCHTGFGNVTAGCQPCQCGSIGARSTLCDPISGACDCLPGVTGLHCQKCLPKHYNYSDMGCKRCDCNQMGSMSPDCDPNIGDCTCKKNVVGRTCNQCQPGFWGLSQSGCVSCDCDTLGSKSESCEIESGQCQCKPGVGGLKCDQCLPKHYNMSSEGCSECEVCNIPGRICDPDTGGCVCPPFTTGPSCEMCGQYAWGYQQGKGCKPCDCNPSGSISGKCDLVTGKCFCKEGYQGAKCQTCARGFYGDPCTKCNCDIAGTQPQHCQDGVCVCDATGQCPCKDNVNGRQCKACKDGTFGLSFDEPAGCKECFCFGRSAKCRDAELLWSSIKMLRPRMLSVNYDNETSNNNVIYPVNTQEICYINLAMPGNNGLVKKNEKYLNSTNNLRIIPSDDGNVEIGVSYLFDSPVYWQLPNIFLGDKVLSYGGFLHFTVETEGGHTLFPSTILSTYPLIQIQGNNKIILEHYPVLKNPSGRHQVRLHESLWKMKNNPKDRVTRDMLMVALQNLQHILIRASDSVDFTEARLRDVSLDTAASLHSNKPATTTGIELCECPSNYSSTSCQDPSLGFYRFRPNVSSTIIIELIGEAKECECNGRSNVCDKETGDCLYCSDNTGGKHCENCAEGFYGNPMIGEECLPCPCPSTNRNFAVSCQVYSYDARYCECKTGYTGQYCDRCSYGYYGYPENGETCKPCKCNPFGMTSDECDEKTGECNCRPGVAGWDCSKCVEKMHVLTENGCTECNDSCTVALLDKLKTVGDKLENLKDTLAGGIMPPWEPLLHTEYEAKELQTLFETSRGNLFLSNQLRNDLETELKSKQKHLNNKLKKLLKNRKPEEAMESSIALKEKTEEFKNEIYKIKNEIEENVNLLRSYSEGDKEKISVSAMLHEAKQILGQIRDTDLETKQLKTDKILRCCTNQLNDLKYIGDRHEIELLYNRLKETIFKNKDFKKILLGIMEKYDMLYHLNNDNQNKTKILKHRIEDIETISSDIDILANSTNYLNKIANVYLLEADDSLEFLRQQKSSLHKSNKDIEIRTAVIKNDIDVLTEGVLQAEKHANDLKNSTDYFSRVFKTDAGEPMRASKAYQVIIESLEEARKAVANAKEAADIAYNKTHPSIGKDSLIGLATTAKNVSTELKLDAKDQLHLVNQLNPELEHKGNEIKTLSAEINALDGDNNFIDLQLDDLESKSAIIKKSLEESEYKCDELIEASEVLEDEVLLLNHNITKKLRPAIEQLESEGEMSVSTVRDMIDESRANTKKAQDIVDGMTITFHKQNMQFQEWNDTLMAQLEALRNKITQAHHIANSIRLSMTSIGDASSSCVRTYQPAHLEPSTMTSIVLTYAISSQLRDALLFYLPSTTTEDFIAVEMVNRKIRFAWNVGGGLGEVTHPLHIQTAGDLSKDQHWYRIEAERVSNIGYLWVRPVVVSEGSPLADSPPATNASASGIGRFDVGPGDRVWVGGADRRHPHLLSTQSGLVGCLYQLSLNGRPIGLWDFSTQNPNSCTACVDGAQEVKDESSFGFSGDGYAVLGHDGVSTYNKYLFSLSLSFKTFDANALLFFGIGNQTERYIMLSLQDGHVVFKIAYDNGSVFEIITNEKYNNGAWHHIEASRYYDRKKKLEKGLLKVGIEVKDGSPSIQPKQETIPDMSSSKYYIGGVPPGFMPIDDIPGSFLGCMSGIQIDQGSYSLLKGTYWGVQASCPNKPLTVAGFKGNGFLELPSHNLKKKDSFSFVFSTSKRDALLMLSTFEGLNGQLDEKEEITNLIEQEDRLSYYSVSLRRGQLDVRLNAGKGEVRLASISSEYGDSKFHSISVTKVGRRLELKVDDTLDAVTQLPDGANNIKAPGELGGLYFGGLPSGFNTTGRTFSNIPFMGTIKDVIFNDKVFGFDHPVRFEGVTIGRFGPMNGHEPNSLLRGSTGCRKISNFLLEPNHTGAVKFGDSDFSHVQVNLRKRAMLQKNFTLELDFRTFYQNGLLFMIPGAKERQPYYLMAALKNGRVQIVLKGNRKIQTTAQAVFNDGIWHKMVLEKQDRKMTLKIDSIDPDRTKMPKKINIGGLMYIGGLPENGANLPPKVLEKLEGFKGCIRGLKVNNRIEHLAGEKTSFKKDQSEVTPFRVGQCFLNVERGSYFPGDAYAVYKNKFNFGTLLGLELEFRTSEMNGILLSVSEPHNYPAFSLELHDGKVIMCGDMGDRRPFKVVQEFASKFTVCDNKWHRIQVHYNNDELTLRVDNLDQSYWLSDNGHLTKAYTSSPLYIGGIPDQAPSGTLETRENFRGCIRNVIISGERRDWIAMASLHNVLLTSCSVAT